MNIENYQLFSFDLDGTLIDSAPDLAKAMNKVLEQEGYQALPVPQVRPLVGEGGRKLLEYGFAHYGVNVYNWKAEKFDSLVQDFLNYYEKCLTEDTFIFNGADAFLKKLKDSEKILLMATNKPQKYADMIAKEYGWDKIFHAIIGGDTPSVKKPDARHILEGMQKAISVFGDMSIELETIRAVHYGDTNTDLFAAKNAEISYAHVTFGYGKNVDLKLVDYVIESF